MISWSGIMTALVRILSYVRVSDISKMAAYNRKCLRNNVYHCLYTSSVMTHDLKNMHSRWNFVATMCASWATRYFISTSGSRPPSLIFYPPWRRPVPTFVPLCCSTQADSVEISHKFHLQCQVQVFPVSRPPIWFPVELASNCAQGYVAISSGDFGILKNKCSNVEFAPKVIYALWFNGHQVYDIFIKKSSTPPSLPVT